MSGFHSDAQADQDLIWQELTPAFEQIGNELRSARQDIDDLKEVIYKVVTGLHGAVNDHRKAGLSEELNGKYGPDLDELDGLHGDIGQGDYRSKLLDALMGDDVGEDRDGFIATHMAEAKKPFEALKARFGVAPQKVEQTSIEVAPEGEGEKEAESAPVKESDKLMSVMGELAGKGKRK
jgi:hypothetical protein